MSPRKCVKLLETYQSGISLSHLKLNYTPLQKGGPVVFVLIVHKSLFSESHCQSVKNRHFFKKEAFIQ